MEQGGERRSISGIRGTAETLPCAKVARYCQAYATLLRELSLGNTIVVGRDTRATSSDYADAAIEAMNRCGWDVIDLGVVPTPTVQIAIAKFAAAGGIAITASHNPREYNGIKCLQNRLGHGMFLDKELVTRMFDVYDSGAFDERRHGERRPVSDFAAEFDAPPYTAEFLDRNRIGTPVDNHVILDYHLARVVEAMGRELDVIRGMDFHVALDPCAGAGIPIDFVLLDLLYCNVRRVNDVPGRFMRPIEPSPANLEKLCKELEDSPQPLDVAFVTDTDNDRCVLVAFDRASGKYRPLAEDYTIAIAVDQVLSASPPGSTVVTNWSTSQALYDITRSHHAILRRVPTGEVYTAGEALHCGAAIAGEGSCAGVIDPRVGMGRDVLAAMWHVLGSLAQKERSLDELVSELPRYHQVSRDHPNALGPDENRRLLDDLQAFYATKNNILLISREDGLVVCFDDRSRVQIRASNTEPLLRVRVEAPDRGRAEALAEEALGAADPGGKGR